MEPNEVPEIEYRSDLETTHTFRLSIKDKRLYEDLRDNHEVTNLAKICRDAFTNALHKVAEKVKGKI